MPTFGGVENIEIINISTQQIACQLDLVFHNPNTFTLDLANADLTIRMEDIDIPKINQTYHSEMLAKSAF